MAKKTKRGRNPWTGQSYEIKDKNLTEAFTYNSTFQLWGTDHHPDHVEQACRKSLKDLHSLVSEKVALFEFLTHTETFIEMNRKKLSYITKIQTDGDQ